MSADPTAKLTKAQQQLVTQSKARVEAIVGSAQKRFPDNREVRAEMLQAGWAACAACALTYDPSLEVPFHGYFGKRVYGAAVEAAIALLYGKRRVKSLRAMQEAAASNDEATDDDETAVDLLAPPRDPRAEMKRRAMELAGMLVSAATKEAAHRQADNEDRERDELRRKMLEGAIATLPDHEQRVVRAVWYEGKRPEDVAAVEKVHARSIRRYEARAMATITAYVNAHADDASDAR